ncbi:MAG TPA: site-specific DNA-methyltransferase [Azospirillaceae bacterium]|nr:site-specific DNA-methyltransferase [Azospirillaceae bacterium]
MLATLAGTLFQGDNLAVLRGRIPDASIDLVYLDPPFASNAVYRAGGQAVFDDTWRWGPAAEAALAEAGTNGPPALAALLSGLRAVLGDGPLMAYLAMMAPRLVELHRVLKPTGSLYLHCDPTASHYLKIVLDALFGAENYRNEIVWRRTGSHNKARRFAPVHDIIHFVTKGPDYHFTRLHGPYLARHIALYFSKTDARGRYWTNALTGAGIRNGESGQPWRGYDPTARGRHWAIPGRVVEELGIDSPLGTLDKLEALAGAGLVAFPASGSGAMPTYKQYLDTTPGLPLGDLWAYQPHSHGLLHESGAALDEDVRWLAAHGDGERVGYPTQKPTGLLERIVAASCPEGGIALDPFCGSGTTLHAAQRLGRRWIGIDEQPRAVETAKRRLEAAFPEISAAIVPL